MKSIQEIKEWMHWRGIETKDLIMVFFAMLMMVSSCGILIAGLIYSLM